MGPLNLDASAPGFERDFAAFLARNRDTDENVDRIVADIVADVRKRGDAALLEYTRKFDKVETDAKGLRLTDAERRTAAARVPAAQREALEFAAKRIEDFHRALLPRTSTSPMPAARGWAHATARSIRSASMCRAARRPIRRRC